MTPEQPDLPWAIYARLSRRKPKRTARGARRPKRYSEDEYSVQGQVDDCLAYARARGLPWTKGHVYVDNHLSAWKEKGGRRPDWLLMMVAAYEGRIAGILVWKLDRFTRAPGDMERLIELADEHRLTIAGPLSGDIDLNTADGRKRARDATNDAAYESDKISERVRKAYTDGRAEGDVFGGGNRPFGFASAGSGEHNPIEVEALRQGAADILERGLTSVALAGRWNKMGLLTTRGNQWGPDDIQRVYRSPRYGGHVVHRGKVVGKVDEEPILDEETYARMQALLASRRRGRRPKAERYELSGLARCQRCDRPLGGGYFMQDGEEVTQYRCNKAHGGCGLAIRAKHLESLVQERAVEILSDGDVLARLVTRDVSAREQRAEARRREDEARRGLVDLEVKLARREIIRGAYDKAKEVYDADLLRAQADLEALPADGSTTEILGDVATLLAAMTPVERRRIYVRLDLAITVAPGRRGRNFDPERVTIKP